MTRHHYFHQLKMDVVEGRIGSNNEQVIVLASHSLQAEFGDYDQEKDTAEYLKDIPRLPKPMVSQLEDRQGALDCILAKDDGGKDVLLAPSLTGICVRKGDEQQPQFYKWNEITNLVNHKKYFNIELSSPV